VTIAVLRADGKFPDRRDEFTILVTEGTSCGRHCEKTGAGMGSRSHDLIVISFRIVVISLSLVG